MDYRKFLDQLLTKANRNSSTYKGIDCYLIYMMFSEMEVPMTFFKRMLERMIIGNDFDNLLERAKFINSEYQKNKCRGYTYDKCIAFYGKTVGKERWDEYCNKQSVTNTFEYKNKKYGMTKEEFDEYNASRAVTLENLQQKYGEETGKEKFIDYCNKQRTAGISLEYFIEKYGVDAGTIKHAEVSAAKSPSLVNFKRRYGDDLGLEKYIEFMSNRFCSFYSKVSQDMFDKICLHLPESLLNHVYYATKNKEFGKYDDINKCYYFYDFVISSIKICIEFHGDMWHANPNRYSADDYIKVKGLGSYAKDIWAHDALKKQLLENLGYEYITIWESDFNSDPEKTIMECVNAIIKRHQLES